MSNYRDIIHLFREVSRIAFNYEGYTRNSFIVEGSRRLASMIERGFFPEEYCHWIAKCIVPHRRYCLGLFRAINHHFDASFAELIRNLVVSLYDVTRNYTPEREGTDNPNFCRIITTPSEQFTTFFPGDIGTYSYREILAEENISEPEYSSDTESGSNSDIDSEDEDDFIDPENPPEYDQSIDPLPLYENRCQDELLAEGPPIYSEFSLRVMLMSMVRSLA
jgi:hypothetical protein